jgi:CheY-like chemotaxis protein
MAMCDGFSASNDLGLGLPGARRLMDEFDVVSEVPAGTTITLKKWSCPRRLGTSLASPKARSRTVKKIIIAEDDRMIADLLEDVLINAGYDVCGIASTVAEAVELCNEHRPDLAVLDVRLAGGGRGTDIARQVKSRHRLGILYATANPAFAMLTASDGEGCVTKPYLPADIVRASQIVLEMMSTGKASKPFPQNFQILQKPDSNYEQETTLNKG